MRVQLRFVLTLILSVASVTASASMPQVTPADLPAQPVVGSQFTFKLSFENASPQPGYAPFLDIVLPAGGNDYGSASGPCDGATFVTAALVNVNPANTPLDIQVTNTPCPATAPPVPAVTLPQPHPLSAFGVPAVILPAGSQLVTIRLPYGSYDDTQPPAEVTITAKMHPYADVNVPLTVYYRAGFALGTTPLNDSSTDPPVFIFMTSPTNALAWPNSTITPVLASIKKLYLGPEDETAAGPNFPRQYQIVVSVPPVPIVHKLTNVTINDCEPPSVTFTSATANPPTTLTAPPCIIGTYPVLNNDATLTINFFGNNTPAWFPNGACAHPVKNAASVTASWLPDDPRDTAVVTSSQQATKAITIKALATQKTVTLPPGGIIPGSTIQYTIDFQVADYLRFGDLSVIDIMSDGMTLVPGSLMLRVQDKTGAFGPTAIPSTAFIVSRPVTGDAGCANVNSGIRIGVFVSSAIGALKSSPASFPANTMTGGLVGGPSTVPATGTITYSMKVDDTFAFPPHFLGGTGPDGTISPDDGFVDKNDPLFNRVEITGFEYSLGLPPVKLTQTCTDDSKQCLNIADGPLTKRVVARNQTWFTTVPDPVLNLPKFAAGDTITYKLSKIMPSGDAQDITFYDWVPKPVLAFPALSATAPVCGSSPPAVNTVCYAVTTTGSVTIPPPTVAVLLPDGQLRVRFAPFNNTSNSQLTLEIYFTLQISSAPFADGLHLTNESQECEYDSYGTRTCMLAIAAFELTEPRLRILKGVVRSDSAAVFRPAPPSPAAVTWAVPPSSAVPRFTPGIITSQLLSMNPNAFQSDLDGDANDNITFSIIVENLGSGLNGAHNVTVSDPLASLGPNIIVNPASVQVTNGLGTPLAFTGSLALPAGITLNAPLAPYSLTGGTNIAVITFDAKIIGTVSPGCFPNTATITNYAATNGGPNFVTAGYGGPFSDTANVCVTPILTKCVLATSESKPTPKNDGLGRPQLAIGEIVRYRLTVQVPEGTIPSMSVKDLLPPGMTFLNDNTAQFAYIANNSLTAAALPCPVNIGSTAPCTTFTGNSCIFPNFMITGGPPFLPGTAPTFSIGNLVNSDNDANAEFLIISFNAVVNNVAGNVAGTLLRNQFQVFSGTTLLATSPFTDIVVVEPKLSVQKSVKLTTSLGNPVPTYKIVVNNPAPLAGATAHDVVIKDVFGPNLVSPVIVTATAAGGATTPAVITQPNGLTATVVAMPPQSSVTIEYKATILCMECEKLTNTATVTWTSLPGLNGTTPNPTGSITPGNPGAVDGERTGTMPAPNTYVVSATASPCGTICGVKFNDLNGNGKLDPGEPPLSGWTISSGAQSFTTGADGQYCFAVPAGTHAVCEQQRPPWIVTTPPGGCATAVVTEGGKNTVNFGNHEDVPLSCVKPPAQMVGWWPLDEGAGATSFKDIIGGNNATPSASPVGGTQAPQPVSGMVSGAIQFPKFGNGLSGARVSPQGALATVGSADFTIDTWVKFLSAPAGRPHYIVNKFDSVQNKGYALYVISPGIAGNERLEFKWGDGANVTTVQTISALTPGQWHHVAATFTRNVAGNALDIRLYVDGAQQGQQTGNPPGLGSLVNFVFLEIGWQPGTVDEPITLDELEIFNVALPLSDIQSIYNAGPGGKCK
ncbi:MAG: hypothetical protein QOK37_907 [Thermoanaerobaculia bacterium]|jgi:hypothetical protein|nr:hypothetical protein [Thermoanaerobaculia bacterium]